MKPGDTVITPEGKEGKVFKMTRNEWIREYLVYVFFKKPKPHWKVGLESEFKVKQKK